MKILVMRDESYTVAYHQSYLLATVLHDLMQDGTTSFLITTWRCSMSKVMVMYYSGSGHTKRQAEVVCQKVAKIINQFVAGKA